MSLIDAGAIAELQQAAQRLGALGDRVAAVQTDEAYQIVRDIALDAALYPPPPPGSRYERTGDLGDGWEPRIVSAGVRVEAVALNGVPYGRWVMGPTDQAEVHAGRWRTTDRIAEQWEPQAAERLERVAVAAMERGV